jgi:hypothetical protein
MMYHRDDFITALKQRRAWYDLLFISPGGNHGYGSVVLSCAAWMFKT